MSGEGDHTVDYYARNGVGLESIHQTGYVNIDTADPVSTASGLQATGHTGWSAVPQTVTLAASDALSGVAATHYIIDGGAVQTYTAPFTVAAEG